MNEKQKRFCDEYLIDCNATQAAIRAGYSPRTANEQGSRLLANASIKAYIDEQLEQLHNEKTADAKEILEYLTAVMRGEYTEQVLRLAGNGVQEISDISVSTKDRIKAAEMLAKRYGLLVDKISVQDDSEILVKVEYEGNHTGEQNI